MEIRLHVSSATTFGKLYPADSLRLLLFFSLSAGFRWSYVHTAIKDSKLFDVCCTSNFWCIPLKFEPQAAASFKHVSPAGAAIGIPLSDEDFAQDNSTDTEWTWASAFRSDISDIPSSRCSRTATFWWTYCSRIVNICSFLCGWSKRQRDNACVY